jgi:hypothetical protein
VGKEIDEKAFFQLRNSNNVSSNNNDDFDTSYIELCLLYICFLLFFACGLPQLIS